MTTRGETSRFGFWAALAVCAAGLLAYSNSFTGEFVWDDVSSVLLHEHVQDPSQFVQLFKEDQHAFGRGQGNFYRPLVAASFMLDSALARPSAGAVDPETGLPDLTPFLFHATNLAWHLAAALLMLALLRRLNAAPWAALAVALLWVVHPLHTEAVTYISGRADSMAAAFMFAALNLALLRGGAGRRIAGALLSALFFVAALLSKESAAIYPFLLLLVIALEPRLDAAESPSAVYLRRALPAGLAIALLVGYGVLRATWLKFASSESVASSFGQRIIETGQSFALYIRVIFLPTGLHMERTLVDVPVWLALVGYLLLAGCMALFVVGLRRGHYRVALGMGWFLIAWFPISGLIPLNAPMAEHWMYVPLAGFLLALVEWVWQRLHSPAARQFAAVAAYAALLLFVGLSVDRNADWKNNETIYLATLAKNPDSIKARYNLAVTYEVLRPNLPGAKRHYEKILSIYDKMRAESGDQGMWPQEREAHVALGNILAQEGQFEAAIAHYTEVLKSPAEQEAAKTVTAALLGRGKALLAVGDLPNAFQDLQRAVTQDPSSKSEAAALAREAMLLGTR
ncbi:MAG: tetratricopeptide repeat protein [FCB group bacterium]|jgi:tetratricopeptide (TPR) repeat protein|nr:tetratricopeptide repeat protein [FCB group bacterium]